METTFGVTAVVHKLLMQEYLTAGTATSTVWRKP